MRRYLTLEEIAGIRAAELQRWSGDLCNCGTTNGKVHRFGCPCHQRPEVEVAQENLMAEVRTRLWQASVCERRGEVEIADAYGAVAANKLARVCRIAANILPMEKT